MNEVQVREPDVVLQVRVIHGSAIGKTATTDFADRTDHPLNAMGRTRMGRLTRFFPHCDPCPSVSSVVTPLFILCVE